MCNLPVVEKSNNNVRDLTSAVMLSLLHHLLLHTFFLVLSGLVNRFAMT